MTLRLSRQRPGQVRARPRAEPPGVWWRRVPWAHIGTVVGAVAAIGGLIFTGVATFYGAKVSEAQLDQSGDDAERERREQAMRVTYWVEDGWDGDNLHVVNRSPDPVTRLGFAVPAAPITATRAKHLYFLLLNNVPPCTELVFPDEDIQPLSGPSTHVHLNRMKWDVRYLRFTDRDGKHWHRTRVGLSERRRPFEGWPGDGALFNLDLPKEKRATPCGDYGG
ncbi:hypothetical protein [Streptomyces chartreusis]|uniref:hypothetical protein n=1 Tax=Streptomyces chartreusis TaxID=1969 RepID=UPI00343536E3